MPEGDQLEETQQVKERRVKAPLGIVLALCATDRIDVVDKNLLNNVLNDEGESSHLICLPLLSPLLSSALLLLSRSLLSYLFSFPYAVSNAVMVLLRRGTDIRKFKTIYDSSINSGTSLLPTLSPSCSSLLSSCSTQTLNTLTTINRGR